MSEVLCDKKMVDIGGFLVLLFFKKFQVFCRHLYWNEDDKNFSQDDSII